MAWNLKNQKTRETASNSSWFVPTKTVRTSAPYVWLQSCLTIPVHDFKVVRSHSVQAQNQWRLITLLIAVQSRSLSSLHWFGEIKFVQLMPCPMVNTSILFVIYPIRGNECGRPRENKYCFGVIFFSEFHPKEWVKWCQDLNCLPMGRSNPWRGKRGVAVLQKWTERYRIDQ